MEITFGKATTDDVERVFQLEKKLINDYETDLSLDFEKIFNWIKAKIENNIESYKCIYFKGIKEVIMRKALSEMTLEELWELFPIILKEHNPAYKEWYIIEKNEIINTIGINNIKRINHIGSSSVEGLISKPTVDILLELDCNSDVEQIKSKLSSTGWTLMSFDSNPKLNMSFNKGYTPNGFAEKVYHLHVRYWGDWNELYFRDYLLLNKQVAKEYGKLKQELQEKYKHNRDGYTEAKTEFIQKYTKIARKELGNKYTPKL